MCFTQFYYTFLWTHNYFFGTSMALAAFCFLCAYAFPWCQAKTFILRLWFCFIHNFPCDFRCDCRNGIQLLQVLFLLLKVWFYKYWWLLRNFLLLLKNKAALDDTFSLDSLSFSSLSLSTCSVKWSLPNRYWLILQFIS